MHNYIKEISFITNLDKYLDDLLLKNLQDKNFYEKYIQYETPKITCGILTSNEERCIERCIRSIYNEVDEIILLDSYSIDKTIPIVKRNFSNVKIFQKQWCYDFSKHRNKILELSNNDWIFFLDADEYLSKSDNGKLKKLIKLISFLFGNDVCISPLIKNTNGFIYTSTKRIFNRSSNIQYFGRIHEEPLHENSKIPEQINIDLTLLHDGYQNNIVIKKNKISRNINLIKKMLNEEPKNPKWNFYFARELFQYTKTFEINTSKYDDMIYNNLKKAIIKYKKNNNKNNLLCYALVVMCDFLFSKLQFEELRYYVNLLKKEFPYCMDWIYFESSLFLIECNIKLDSISKNLEEDFINNKITYSYLYSNKSHLYYLLAITFFQSGEYAKAFNNLKKIKRDQFTDIEKFESIMIHFKKQLSIYLKENNITNM